jgi:hypothetical protein
MLLVLSFAFAQDSEPNPEPNVVYAPVSTLNYEDPLKVEGELQRPSAKIVLQRRGAEFNPLIRLRLDFDDAMADSISQVK